MSMKEPQITRLDKKSDEEFLSSGIAELDELVGGIPRSRITEFWGQESVGKTTLLIRILAHLSQTRKVLFVDSEFALNANRAAALGVNMKNVDYIQDARLERVCELILASVGKYDVIMLDSLPYLTPLTVDSQDIGENAIGLTARLIKHWVIKLRPRLGVSKTALLVVNQYRTPFGMYAKPEPPGGKAYHHAVDVRLYLTSNSTDKIKSGTQTTGHWVHAKVVKSKVSPPFKETKIKIEY